MGDDSAGWTQVRLLVSAYCIHGIVTDAGERNKWCRVTVKSQISLSPGAIEAPGHLPCVPAYRGMEMRSKKSHERM